MFFKKQNLHYFFVQLQKKLILFECFFIWRLSVYGFRHLMKLLSEASKTAISLL